MGWLRRRNGWKIWGDEEQEPCLFLIEDDSAARDATGHSHQEERAPTTPLRPCALSGTQPIERCINGLKQHRRVATRYEKLAVNYLAMAPLAAILMWL